MSKNITIAEGTQARNFNNIHKLRTNLIGGGTQYWVPEDEAGDYAKLSEKSITSNGTYNASDDGKDGFSKVTVNVQPRTTSKSINENGRYYARDDGYDGYSSVEVNVSGGGGNLIEKTITENGLYAASSDGADGYNQVNVNVNRVVAVDSSKDGGNDNEYLIDTTQNGDVTIIKKTLLPSSILITTSPNKKRYVTGETIDISGMVVKAYKRDGGLWTSTNYPDGIIPNSELIIEPNTVTIAPGHRRKSNGAGFNVLEVRYIMQKVHSDIAGIEYVMRPTADDVFGRYNGRPLTLGSDDDTGRQDGARFYITKYDNQIYAYGINIPCGAVARYSRLEDGYWGNIYSSSYSTEIGRWNQAIESQSIGSAFDIPISLVDPRLQDVNTLSSDGMMVNVKWRRPQDGQVLVDLLPIKVSAAS